MSKAAMVDRNSMRFGAGLSAVVLLIAFVFQAEIIVPLMAVVLGVGSIFGLRKSPLGAIYRATKKALKLGIPVEPEEEPPPRFAMTLGFVVLGLASVLLYALESDVLGWGFALAVAALQTLLATTGICVGCEIYLFTRRVSAKGA